VLLTPQAPYEVMKVCIKDKCNHYKTKMLWLLTAVFLANLILPPSLAHAEGKTFSLLSQLNRPVTQLVMDLINKDIKGRFEANEARYFAPNRIHLGKVTLFGSKGQRIIEVDSLDASISIWALIRGKIELYDAVIEGARVKLKHEDNKLDIEEAFESRSGAQGAPPPDLSLSSGKLTRGDFELRNEAGVQVTNKDIAIGDISLGFKGGQFKLNAGLVETRVGEIYAAKLTFPVKDFIGKRISIANDNLEVGSLAAIVSGTHIKAHGKLDLKQQIFDLIANAESPRGFWPQGLKPIGLTLPPFSARITLMGAFSRPTVGFEAKTGAFTAQGIAFESAHLVGETDENGLSIQNSTLRLAAGGTLKPTLLYGYETKEVDAKVGCFDADISLFLKLFGAQIHSSGTFSGRVHLQGKTAPHMLFQIGAEGGMSNAKVADVIIGTGQLALNAALTQNSFDILDFKLNADDLNASASGQLGLVPHADINVNLRVGANKPARHYPPLAKDFNGHELVASGTLTGSFERVRLDAELTLQKLSFLTLEGRNLSGRLSFQQGKIAIHRLRGDLYGGDLTGELGFQIAQPQTGLAGTLHLHNAKLAKAAVIKKIPWLEGGSISAQISLSGTTQKTETKGEFTVVDTQMLGMPINKLAGQLEQRGDRLNIIKLFIDAPGASMLADATHIDLKAKTIATHIGISFLDLAAIKQDVLPGLAGICSGDAYVSGPFDNLSGKADLNVGKAALYGKSLGFGSLAITLEPHSSDKQAIMLSGFLKEDKGAVHLQATLLPKSQRLRAHVQLADLPLEKLTKDNNFYLQTLYGPVNGYIDLYGDAQKPNIDMKIHAPNVFYRAAVNKRTGEYPHGLGDELSSVGPAEFEMTYADKQLSIKLCALPAMHSKTLCSDGDAVHILAKGLFESPKEFDLTVNSKIHVDDLERIVSPLEKESISANVAMELSGRFQHSKNPKKNQTQGRLAISSLAISTPSVPRISLKAPALVQFTKEAASLKEAAKLTLGKSELELLFDISTSKVRFYAAGDIPLLFARLFTNVVVAAEGVATGDLHVDGTWDYPATDGTLTPKPGSSLTLREGFESLEFRSGQLTFHSSKENGGSTLINVDQLEADIGEGRATLDGTLKLYPKTAARSEKTAWDMHLAGSGIVVRSADDFLETNVNLDLKTIQDQDWLTGKINITDGYRKQRFDLQNFILSSKGQASSFGGALPAFIKDIKLSTDVAVQSFHVDADMVVFYADLYFNADLNLTGALASPKLVGALTLNESSALYFPAATFAMTSTVIPFLDVPGKTIAPKIDIAATASIPEMVDGRPNETLILLTLAGDLNKLKLDLKAIEGNKNKTPFQILVNLINPMYSSSAASNTGAVTSLAGQLPFRPITSELETAVQGLTKTRFRLGSSLAQGGLSTQLQWQLGPRIEVSGISSATASGFRLQDAKLTLLIFDHLPVGKKLFFESTFKTWPSTSTEVTSETKLQFKYRILER
jgi:hypothetical protein